MIIGEAHRGQGHVVAPVIAPGFAQDDSEGARLQWRQVAGQLGPKVAKLAALMSFASRLTVEGSLDRSLGAYDAAAFEPSAVIGSAAEELMVCRLFAGGEWIRTICTQKMSCRFETDCPL